MAKKGTAAGTALGPTFIAATEQFLPPAQRILDDPMALSMLTGSARFFANLCKWKWARRLIFNETERKGPGVWGGILCRKRFIDEAVFSSAKAGIAALVILGAGYDTRGARFATSAGLPAFELDLPENVAAKRAVLEKVFGSVPVALHLVPVDFETTDLNAILADNGHDPDAKTIFVLEGVTQYLTEPAIRTMFDFLARAATGSRLVFTYVPADFIAGSNMYNDATIYRYYVEGYKIWHYGLDPQELPAFLSSYGWRLIEDVEAKDHRRRYLEPAGRELPIMEIERIVLAEKTG
jgi:methyltransferase (TIGR00027 family)